MGLINKIFDIDINTDRELGLDSPMKEIEQKFEQSSP